MFIWPGGPLANLLPSSRTWFYIHAYQQFKQEIPAQLFGFAWLQIFGVWSISGYGCLHFFMATFDWEMKYGWEIMKFLEVPAAIAFVFRWTWSLNMWHLLSKNKYEHLRHFHVWTNLHFSSKASKTIMPIITNRILALINCFMISDTDGEKIGNIQME